jgi:protein SCO1/2
VLLACLAAGVAAQSPSSILPQVRLDQNLDAQLPLDLEFRDEAGKSVRLGDYFSTRPVVLTLVYYRCPMLCNEVLSGLLKTSQAVPFVIGHEYDVLTISIDPSETSELAAQKKESYVRKYRRAGADAGWHFLVGDQESIDRVTKAVGFRYRYDPASGQFAHAAGIVVLTPAGRLSRYFYGIDYPPGDLRLALVESSAGKIGSPVDQILLLCFHYDPATGKYGLIIARAIQLAGLATLLVLGTFLTVMFRRERRLSRLVRQAGAPAGEALQP